MLQQIVRKVHPDKIGDDAPMKERLTAQRVFTVLSSKQLTVALCRGAWGSAADWLTACVCVSTGTYENFKSQS